MIIADTYMKYYYFKFILEASADKIFCPLQHNKVYLENSNMSNCSSVLDNKNSLSYS